MAQLGYTWYPQDWWTSNTFKRLKRFPLVRYAVRELFDLMYKEGGPVDMNRDYLLDDFGIVLTDEEYTKLMDFVEILEDGKWWIPSVKKRISKAESARENGKKGGRPRGVKPSDSETQKPNIKTYIKNPHNPPLEIESKIESKNDYVVKENPTTVSKFGFAKDHESLRDELKRPTAWKDMFGKQSGANPDDRDAWIDEFIEHAIADGKSDFILQVSEAQSWITNWVRKRVQAGETPKSRKKIISSSDHLAAVAGIPLN